MTNAEWQEVMDAEPGHIFADWYAAEYIRCLIMRGGGSLCAYIGVPENHPLAGFHYDDLPLDCHGGLTFGDKGHDRWPEGWYWYGWDYAHYRDFSTYYERDKDAFFWGGTKWTVPMVRREVEKVVEDFLRLRIEKESKEMTIIKLTGREIGNGREE